LTRGDEHRIADILEAAAGLATRLPESYEEGDDDDLRLIVS